MKNIFNFAIVAGIMIIISGAGGYETMSASFVKSVIIMISGAMLMGLGVVGKEKFAKLGKKCVKNGVKNSRTRKNAIALTAEKVCRKTA